jgi:hypothetical protein
MGAHSMQQLLSAQVNLTTFASWSSRRVLVNPATITLVINAGSADVNNMGVGGDRLQQISQAADLGCKSTLTVVPIVTDRNQELVDLGKPLKCPSIGPVCDDRLHPLLAEHPAFVRLAGRAPDSVSGKSHVFSNLQTQVSAPKNEYLGV